MDYLEQYKDITHLSNLRTPAVSRYYFEVQEDKDIDKIYDIRQFCKQRGIPFFLVGGGTNILFAFSLYPGVIVKNCLTGWSYNVKTQLLTTYSEEKIRTISSSLETDYGQTLWHRFIGLPGSIGGAVFGNAGCFGLEVGGNFFSAFLLDLETGKKEVFLKDDMDFSYRNSKLKKSLGKYFIISLEFDLSENREKYASEIDNIYFREYKQPKGNSCGSFFKNPSGIIIDDNGQERVIIDAKQIALFKKENLILKNLSAAYLIEHCGLKGYFLGEAYFSEIHSNFLMHTGQGSHHDILALIKLAKLKVKEKFGIDLESEVQVITI